MMLHLDSFLIFGCIYPTDIFLYCYYGDYRFSKVKKKIHLFSEVHGTFSETDCILGHKARLKCKNENNLMHARPVE